MATTLRNLDRTPNARELSGYTRSSKSAIILPAPVEKKHFSISIGVRESIRPRSIFRLVYRQLRCRIRMWLARYATIQ